MLLSKHKIEAKYKGRAHNMQDIPTVPYACAVALLLCAMPFVNRILLVGSAGVSL